METFLTVLYVIVCIFLVLVVLLQSGKGGGIGAALGGGSQTVFGGAGAGNFLTRLTSIAATLFMVLSISLAYLSSSSEKAIDRAGESLKAKTSAVGSVKAGAKGEAKKTKAEKTEGPASAAPADDTPASESSTSEEVPGADAAEPSSDAPAPAQE